MPNLLPAYIPRAALRNTGAAWRRQHAARNAGTVPHARVTLPSGQAGLVPVWLPVRGMRSGGSLALHMPTLGAMPTRGARRP